MMYIHHIDSSNWHNQYTAKLSILSKNLFLYIMKICGHKYNTISFRYISTIIYCIVAKKIKIHY